MKIDISYLGKAIDSLEEVLRLEKTAIIRDSTIQRFEYVFEFTVRFIKRYIEQNYSNLGDYDPSSFRDIIRTALQIKIITKSFDDWIKFRDARNKTSHGYSEKAAEEVYKVAQDFLPEAKFVHEFLKKNLA